MSAKQRREAIVEFENKKLRINVMLCVSQGRQPQDLNLTAASQGPSTEPTALAKNVRFACTASLVRNTVEDRILALQDKKRQIIEAALDEKANQDVCQTRRRGASLPLCKFVKGEPARRNHANATPGASVVRHQA
ncbi:hypothetical protein MRB53_038107 [Persea americana]|nr:hypothetical protein MRB53_038107 [Persea americana]